MAKRKPPRKAAKKMPASLAEAARQSMEPVDPELFLWCQGVYYAAASLSMPVQNPEYTRIPLDEKGGFVLKDIPMNRGMMAVLKELHERKATENVKMAMMARLMHFGEIMRAPALTPYVKPTGNGDELSVSEAVIKACATAKFVMVGDKMRFDIDDIARIAQQLTDEEEAQERQKNGADPV